MGNSHPLRLGRAAPIGKQFPTHQGGQPFGPAKKPGFVGLLAILARHATAARSMQKRKP
jgi:hypothetical protein